MPIVISSLVVSCGMSKSSLTSSSPWTQPKTRTQGAESDQGVKGKKSKKQENEEEEEETGVHRSASFALDFPPSISFSFYFFFKGSDAAGGYRPPPQFLGPPFSSSSSFSFDPFFLLSNYYWRKM